MKRRSTGALQISDAELSKPKLSTEHVYAQMAFVANGNISHSLLEKFYTKEDRVAVSPHRDTGLFLARMVSNTVEV